MRAAVDGFLILVYVFTLIFGVYSMIEMKNTIPQGNTFPALIMKLDIDLFAFHFWEPAVPNDVVHEEGKTSITKLNFQSFNIKIKALENGSLSYVCPVRGTPALNSSKTLQCENPLQLVDYARGESCGGRNGEKYDVGYGLKGNIPITSYLKKSKNVPGKKVQYPLYASCLQETKETEKMIYHVEYQLKRKNKLYMKPNIYPQEQLNEVSVLHTNFRREMAIQFNNLRNRRLFESLPDKEVRESIEKKFNFPEHLQLFENDEKQGGNGSYLIPFQLLSHEDMILYNWKLATFHKMNYSLIWSNIAKNSWKNIDESLRQIMMDSNYDLKVVSGVHEYAAGGYPRYLWKFVYTYLKGITIIVHNQKKGDETDYPLLCSGSDSDCKLYGFVENETNKNFGFTYCCPTSELREDIPFFKNRFFELDPLQTTDLFSYNDDVGVSRYTQMVKASEKTDALSKPHFVSNTHAKSPVPQNPILPQVYQPQKVSSTQSVQPKRNQGTVVSDKNTRNSDVESEVENMVNALARWKLEPFNSNPVAQTVGAS